MIIWKEDKQDRTLFTQNPCNHRGSYFFKNFKSTQNVLQYLAPSPTSTANLGALFLPKSASDIFIHSKARHLFLHFC